MRLRLGSRTSGKGMAEGATTTTREARMTDDRKIGEDTIEGEGSEPGKRVGAGLPDEGIEGKGAGTGEGGKTGEGEAGPASGTTEGDDAVGII